jgi:hypothetical protein
VLLSVLLVNVVWLFQLVSSHFSISLSSDSESGYTDASLAVTVVTIGESNDWIPELVERAKGLKVGNGFDPQTEV